MFRDGCLRHLLPLALERETFVMPAELDIRKGTLSDNRAAFDVSMLAMKDLFLRHGFVRLK
jgi:hypothetical protein